MNHIPTEFEGEPYPEQASADAAIEVTPDMLEAGIFGLSSKRG